MTARQTLARAACVLAVSLSTGCSATVDRLAIDDAQTAVRVRTALINDPELGERVIQIRVTGGVAHLSGSVRTQAEADRAVARTRAVDGVRDVEANLEIGAAAPASNGAPPQAPVRQEELFEPQGDSRLLAVGASFGWSGPRLRSLDQGVSVSPLFRLGSGSGFGPTLALNWFKTNIEPEPGQQAISQIHVRPLMVGVGYTVASSRLSVTPSVVGGIAFNSLSVPDTGRAGGLAVGVDNSLVWRPGVSLWFDMNRRVALTVSAGYVLTRLRVTYVDNGRLDKRDVRGDTAIMHAGVAYKLF